MKFNLSKDTLDLSVNNTNSGDGKETLSVKFDHDLEISFNSRYLIDVASQLDGDRVEIFFNDSGSPAPVSYTHLRAHETVLDLVCRLLLEKKNLTKKL